MTLTLSNQKYSLSPWEGWTMAINEYRPGKWRVRVYHKGQRHDFCKTIDGRWVLANRDMAETTERDILGLIRSTKGNLNLDKFKRKRPTRFAIAVDTWIELSTCSLEWLDQRKAIAKKYLIPFFGTMNLEDIEEGHFQQFHASLKQKGLGEKTIHNIFGELKALFRQYKRSIPFMPEFPKIKFQDPIIKFLTPEQQNEVFEFIPEADKPIFTFMRYTGCRPNEAKGLLRENVFHKNDPPHFILSTVLGGKGQLKPNTKTRKAKPLPIVPEIEWSLKPKEVTRYVFTRRGDTYSRSGLWRIWVKANREANKQYGTPIVKFYQGLKHSFGCQRLNDGYSLDEIAAVMGHTSTKTTQKYAKYQVIKLRDVMRGSPPSMVDKVEEGK